MSSREKHFLYDPTSTPLEFVKKYLEDRSISFHISNHMAYHPPVVPIEWPQLGFRLDNFDISFEPPQFDRMHGLELGRIDLAAESESKNYKRSLKLFNELKNQFAVPKKRLDELLNVKF